MKWKYVFIIYAIYLVISAIIKVIGEKSFPGNVYLFHLINDAQISPLNPIMVFFSKYGREYIWIPVTAILFIVGGKYRRSSLLLVGGFIIAIILGEISKYAMAQPRPFLELSHVNLLVPKPTDFSYPSGHALIVSVGAVIVLLTLPYYISIPLLVEALIVSYSRVYVGVHWPLDVLAGWILGIAIGLTAINLENFINKIYYKVSVSVLNSIHKNSIYRKNDKTNYCQID
ncbi:PAP2 family protein [Sulfolobus sp. A20-N-F6]|uniref:undecaprenyl-diphosphatase SepP n=1 Tax=Sulfolobaceae TaxID=118883 RepID=UPI000845C740|nr:phosphatase PAP2 family protein [Sulfolobus sp. B1]TRM78792.1 PAP2 family protein [Sulfolobus sp. A20-N-F8]TRM82754.1 PAP2 family protein [Sulfolobus sp. A20-N-F6]TRM83157.1 PAP2 family protein [Sulfolobus sp. F3]TRM96632.1 PAP2 family protein [Sulfolobus sp. B1]